MQSETSVAAELAPHLFKSSFDNGMTVVVREMPGTRVATVQIWVKAGSVFEEPREAGITHFIEHMIFKGTEDKGPGELAGAIEGAGGRINAYTSYENTVYHATLSASHWEMALELLTESVLHSAFDPVELEREKKVVLEEVGMRNDRPNIKLFHELMATGYTTHPYRLPVIGTEETIKGYTREMVLNYIKKHYQPENFTVVVVGDVNGQEVISKVESLMGGLPREEGAQVSLPAEPEQVEPRIFTINAEIMQPQMAVAIPITQFDHPDTPVLDVIAQITGHGETSRLYRSLRDEKQLVYGIHASAFTPHDPGMFEITAVVDGDKMLPALEASLVELFRLKYFSVTEAELKRAKHSLESDFVFSMERVEGQARVLGSFQMMAGDPREDEYLEQIRSVSQEDIKRVAQTYFVTNGITAGFLVPSNSTFDPDKAMLTAAIEKAEEAARLGDSEALLHDAYLSRTHRFKLDNGITLLVREDSSVPTVGIRAVFPGGLRAETSSINGAFAYINDVLTKGTDRMTARELAETVADMAGSITGFNGKNTFGVKADFLARFFKEGMVLVRDVLRTPAFDPGEAEKIRPELLAHLKQQEDSLTSIAFREFNQLLFDGHPYGLNSIGTEEAIRSFTAASLKNIYEQHARPEQLVLSIAGDVKAEEVRSLVVELFGDWQTKRLNVGQEIEEEILPPVTPGSVKKLQISRDKEQVHLVVGFMGTTLKSPDRFRLELLDTILSGQSGRLFTELRDRQSLAYSLSSFSLFGLDTGSFGIYIGTSPDKMEQAIKGVWQELDTIRNEMVKEEELDRAKNILISQHELAMQTHSAQALEMGLNETYELGQDFGSRYIKEINEVSKEEILAAAQKYILPAQYIMVAVGAGLASEPAMVPESATQESSEQKID